MVCPLLNASNNLKGYCFFVATNYYDRTHYGPARENVNEYRHSR